MAQQRKRICIIGAGAAGLAAAWSLSRVNRFDITIYETSAHVGGTATTISLNDPNGDLWLNNQVQAGSPGFHNTRRFFEQFGFELNPVQMQIAIGSGDFAWNNHAATPFIASMRPEIQRFHRLLLKVRKFEFPFLFISIGRLLEINGFSEIFIRHVIHPVMSLFFAGSASMGVPATAVAQLVFDEDGKMFDFNEDTFLSKIPVIAAFPKLSDVYEAVAAASGARIHLRRRVVSVVRSGKQVHVIDDGSNEAVFDTVVMACPPHIALQILSKPSFLERMVLGRIKKENSDLVIHSDTDYFKRYYSPDPALRAQYHMRRSHDLSSNAIEMTYHINTYQLQLKGGSKEIYQTIDPLNEIDPGSIIEKRKVSTFLHTCTHFTSVVPLWRFIQGKKKTWFCGGHTMINIHEIAIVSGLAVAKKLGAPYPFEADVKAKNMFSLYYGLIHG